MKRRRPDRWQIAVVLTGAIMVAAGLARMAQLTIWQGAIFAAAFPLLALALLLLGRNQTPSADLPPLACKCPATPDQPIATCPHCNGVCCPTHVHYDRHDCPICPRCGFRHGRPVHEIPAITRARRSW